MPADNHGAFSPPGLYPDEAMNGNNAVEAWANHDWKVFYPENFGREGLFINIQSFFVAEFGNTPGALRLPSALFGILTVLGMYFLARALYRHESFALFASFLLAVSFWHVLFSRIGFRAIAAPFFLVWGVYFLISATRNRRWLISALVGGVLFGLGFYTYIAYRITPLLLAAILYFLWRKTPAAGRRQLMRVCAVYLIAAFVVALPIGLYFLGHPADFFGRTTGISIFHSPTPLQDLALNTVKTVGMFNIAGDFNWRQNFAGRPELFLPVGLFFLWGLYLAIQNVKKQKTAALGDATVLSWLVFATLPVVISDEGIPHALRALLMVPPVFLLAARGGMDAYERLKRLVSPVWRYVIVACFCLVMIFEVSAVYFDAWAQNPAVKSAFDYQDYVTAQRINALPVDQMKYVIVPGTSGTIQRDYPISLQSILFLTDTFSRESRAAKHIEYLSPDDAKNLVPAPGSMTISL
ncbi:MAG: glycosyltransferase family 39 protein [Patescibacteria group bacterium]|nr:glycosyltransferase family 39 protein [Patescibacteria group bacterium]